MKNALIFIKFDEPDHFILIRSSRLAKSWRFFGLIQFSVGFPNNLNKEINLRKRNYFCSMDPELIYFLVLRTRHYKYISMHESLWKEYFIGQKPFSSVQNTDIWVFGRNSTRWNQPEMNSGCTRNTIFAFLGHLDGKTARLLLVMEAVIV